MKYIIFIFFSLSSFSQVLFEGVIKDAATKEVLQGASIYVPNSTRGSYSDFEGKFSLELPITTKEIVISFVGYTTIKTNIDLSDGKNVNKTIYLREIKNELNEVVFIKQKQDKNWERMFQVFKTHFIGNSEIAREAEILNPEDVILNEEKTPGKYKLMANANRPLQIKNKITGYIISYELIQFNHIVIGHNQIYTFYLGYPFFKDISNEEKLNQKRIEKKRLEAYLGSSMHFIRALYNEKLQEEGFNVRELIKVPNPDYPNEIELEKILAEVKLTNDYSLIRKLPEKEINKLGTTLLPITKFTIQDNEKKFMKFDNYLNVTYTKAAPDEKFLIFSTKENANFQVSQLKNEDDAVEYFADGNYYNPANLFFYGYMGWKKVGDMLPFDYNP
ncbi:carboxypeptidase-like regulatory domain-containing protein [Flavobacterium lacisediminis]|uniref:Carboxypeptidase-like regulatory domain-containing protein n=1 Tax=Flavobacterium lacisediminis TaxID=2989705 RepID=A0ABT3EIJ1_9FLAO|nr:carboxypeptidase-like regulatory domain-containing protein [Flavobacterium lacisediminis]MCW1147929.1 carboxypeptidase-like regulatory domain-containing protein [Flavobacterium lacisediminis]